MTRYNPQSLILSSWQCSTRVVQVQDVVSDLGLQPSSLGPSSKKWKNRRIETITIAAILRRISQLS